MMEWTTKEGSKIKVEDMETSHIQNSLAMLKRKGFVSPKTVMFYLTCRPPNGEFAMDAFEKEMDQVFDAPVSKFIDIFEEELNKRINRR